MSTFPGADPLVFSPPHGTAEGRLEAPHDEGPVFASSAAFLRARASFISVARSPSAWISRGSARSRAASM